MGKVLKKDKRSADLLKDGETPGASKNKFLRSFLIRRRRSLEVMYTNGLSHWTEFIEKSDVKAPFIISDINLSSSCNKLIAFYSVMGNEAQVSIKTFMKNQYNSFDFYEDSYLASIKNLKNASLRGEDLFEIKIELTQNPRAKNNPE